jgi:radical SAM superfamily enzyme YgiQ (UPF0313 family)
MPIHLFWAQYAVDSMYFPTKIGQTEYLSLYEHYDLMKIFDGARKFSDNIFFSYLVEKVEELLSQSTIFLVGISLTGASQLIPTFTLAHIIRCLDPTIPIVIGGGLVPHIQKVLFQTPECFEFADYYVVGEGESALLGLCEYLHNGGDIESIPNLIYKVKIANEAKITYEYVEDVKSLSFPDYKDMDMSPLGKENVFLIQASRGCSWGHCAFCSLCARNMSTNYREQDMELVVDYMEQLACEFNCKYIDFTDECFTVARLTKLVELLNKRELADKFRYHLLCRFESGLDTSLLQRAYATGLRVISWGLESAHPDTLSFMRKGIEIETAEKCLRDSHLCGIWNSVFMLLDFPGAPADDAKTTLNFILRNKEFIDAVIGGLFRLEYGSHVYKYPQKYNITIIQQPYSSLQYDIHYYDNNTHQYRGYRPKEYTSASMHIINDGLNGTHLASEPELQFAFLTVGPDNFDGGLHGKLAIRSKVLELVERKSSITALFDQAEFPEICIRVPDHIQVNFVIDRPDSDPKEVLIFDAKTFNYLFINITTLQIMINAKKETSLSDLVDKFVRRPNSSHRAYVEANVRKICKELTMGGFLIAKSVASLHTT